MSSNLATKPVSKREAGKVQNILISQPRPKTEKSPYFDLEKKHGVTLEFEALIALEAISGKDFRRQKINIANYTGVIFTSRNAIDHFFRTCDEMKVSVSQDTKYFCITEAVALYLQKFILYRKRKVFYGADGSNKSLLDVINKHKENLNFLYVCSENQQDNIITSWLKQHDCAFDLAFMYRTRSNDVKQSLGNKQFDILCFFTPSGIKSWFDNFPEFKQEKVVIGTFGDNTKDAALKAGLKPAIVAPSPQSPSMITALDQFLSSVNQK
ncbi:uroporphyrinogen-III synthase [Niabella ginsenosidivorans]|uniref:Uroporphyrinogen-III synthase n=1 Tax=Niabella ginsenosidivorans TaxID=1176587 RepID=A0A1A9HXT1_9BACT|nr:uroporphyrinogen-III synthase [Niabella ginsenosidivorans]ANH79885.1 uroporphyrinogen-III synthase [Niabella ginsenosidivorans]